MKTRRTWRMQNCARYGRLIRGFVGGTEDIKTPANARAWSVQALRLFRLHGLFIALNACIDPIP